MKINRILAEIIGLAFVLLFITIGGLTCLTSYSVAGNQPKRIYFDKYASTTVKVVGHKYDADLCVYPVQNKSLADIVAKTVVYGADYTVYISSNHSYCN